MRRRLLLAAMIVVPLLSVWFFLSLLSPGLPDRVPTGVVDMDHSPLSRQMTQMLESEQVVDITGYYDGQREALAAINRGEIYGFFVIPQDFEKNTVGGRQPAIDYYANMTYFVPGTLAFKGFKTTAVMTASGMVKTQLVDIGATDAQTAALLQPVVFDTRMPGNPWTNYCYYLTPSFVSALLALMIMLVTVYAVTMEFKAGSARRWLATAGDSIVIAVSGKLLPYTAVFTLVGWIIESLMVGWSAFPFAGSVLMIVGAMFLFVVACQAFALFVCCLLPNPRMAFSVCSLVAILSFSITGFSFPVESMYGGVAVFSYIVPVRYFYLIYTGEALWGAGVYYARLWYVALILFPIVASLGLPLLKRACRRSQVYVP